MKKFLLYVNIDNDPYYAYLFYKCVATGFEVAYRTDTVKKNIKLYLHGFFANPLRIDDEMNERELHVNPLRISTPTFQKASDIFDKSKVQQVINNTHSTGGALSEFIKEASTNSSVIGKNDVLTMWGHGSGRGLSKQSSDLLSAWSLDQSNQVLLERLNLSVDESVIDSLLYPSEIAAALNDNKLGLIAFNSCFAGTLEFAVALSSNASYMLAPPSTALENSLKYQDWCVSLADPKNRPGGKIAGEIAINLLKTNPESGVMYSLTDLTKIQRVTLAVTTFVIQAEQLILSAPKFREKIIDVQASCQQFAIPLPSIMCIDLHQFAVRLGAVGVLKAECLEIANSIEAAIVARTNDTTSTYFDSSIYGLTVMIPSGEVTPYPSIEPFNKISLKTTLPPAFNKTGWLSLMRSIYQPTH